MLKQQMILLLKRTTYRKKNRFVLPNTGVSRFLPLRDKWCAQNILLIKMIVNLALNGTNKYH